MGGKSPVTALAPHHYVMLHDECGISDEVIRARGYLTIRDAAELEPLNFAPAQRRAAVQLSLFDGASR